MPERWEAWERTAGRVSFFRTSAAKLEKTITEDVLPTVVDATQMAHTHASRKQKRHRRVHLARVLLVRSVLCESPAPCCHTLQIAKTVL